MPALHTRISGGPSRWVVSLSSACNRFRVGHIAADAGEAAGVSVRRRLAAVRYRHSVPRPAKPPGGGQTYAAVAAGDQCHRGRDPSPPSPASLTGGPSPAGPHQRTTVDAQLIPAPKPVITTIAPGLSAPSAWPWPS